MAAAKGNQYAAKAKRFYTALDRAARDEDYAALHRIARKALQLAEQGESWAVTLVRDTLDGKPAQQIDLGGQLEVTTRLVING